MTTGAGEVGAQGAAGVSRAAVYRNSYRDSVELMGMAAELERLPGVARAGIVMGTESNLGVLASAGLGGADVAGAGPTDLIVAVFATDDAAADAALERARALLSSGQRSEGGEAAVARAPQTLADGLEELPDANLVLISTPGTYATAEARKALKRGLNVFMFSDNVSVADEIALKQDAHARGLLVMGPDCGTAIVGGVPLGFANAVRRGPIGLVAASGTGLQQVSCLIHRFGSGVSHALGTGGRDLDERVGGRTMLDAIDLLLQDPATELLVLISKPPAEAVANRILEVIRTAEKPVVVNFLGGDAAAIRAAGGHAAATFEDAARLATDLVRAGGVTPADARDRRGAGARPEDPADEAFVRDAGRTLRPDSTIRGLYSGGSLAGEAKLILRDALGPRSAGQILDLGDDEYTVGRPHPMIDPRLRSEYILAAGLDSTVGVLLLDVVLGHGSHPDPAGALVPAIEEARAAAARDGRRIVIVASVVGTEDDPQDMDRQERQLEDAGVMLESSNARAAGLAARLIAAVRGAEPVTQAAAVRP